MTGRRAPSTVSSAAGPQRTARPRLRPLGVGVLAEPSSANVKVARCRRASSALTLTCSGPSAFCSASSATSGSTSGTTSISHSFLLLKKRRLPVVSRLSQAVRGSGCFGFGAGVVCLAFGGWRLRVGPFTGLVQIKGPFFHPRLKFRLRAAKAPAHAAARRQPPWRCSSATGWRTSGAPTGPRRSTCSACPSSTGRSRKS